MRKVLLSLIILFFVLSCGGSDSEKDSGFIEDKHEYSEVKQNGDASGDVEEVDSFVKNDVENSGSCTSDEECPSGVCIFYKSFDKGECAEECVNGGCKKEGYVCKPWWKDEEKKVCFPKYLTLCQPCVNDDDCLWNNRCIDYGEEGSFCGTLCTNNKDCPQSYYCDVSGYCRSSTKKCKCNGWGIKNHKNTPCFKENINGKCEGVRVCSSDVGLTKCDAKVPTFEKCNLIDDNCNGETDEGICDDGNPCTKDSCDPENGGACIFDKSAMEGALCNADNNGCTKDDFCKDGECVPGNTPDCSYLDSGCMVGICESVDENDFICKKVPAENDTPCDDGNPCTISDYCVDGECVSGEEKDCDDHDPCTDDSCNSETGKCVHEKNTGSPCDDGNPCTLSDKCEEGVCVAGKPKECNDNNPCTKDYCDESSGKCVFAPEVGKECDDNNMCTENDKCDENGKCVGESISCDDGNECTDDLCDPEKGCYYEFNSAPCDDGNPCTKNDTCKEGVCAGEGPEYDFNCDGVDENCNGETDENCSVFEKIESETSPQARSGAVLVASDSSIYMGFGVNENFEFLSDFWKFDPVLKTWKKLNGQGEGRAQVACLFHNGHIYCFGGQKMTTVFNTLVDYDTKTDSWTTLSAEGPSLSGASLNYYNGYLWVYGGGNQSGISNKLWRFELESKVWEQVSLGPEKLMGHSTFVYDDKLWIVCGSTSSSTFNDKVYVYNFNTGGFLEQGTLEIVFSAPGYAFFNNKLFVLGGKFKTGSNDILYEINPDDLKIVIRKNDAGGLVGVAMTVFKDALYIFGGQKQDGSLTNDLWKITF